MMGRLKTVSLRARRCWGQEVSRGLADRALSTLRQKTSQSICPGPLQEFHATLPLIGSMGLSQHGHLLGLTLGHKEGLQHTLHQGRGDVARLEAPKQRDLRGRREALIGGNHWKALRGRMVWEPGKKSTGAPWKFQSPWRLQTQHLGYPRRCACEVEEDVPIRSGASRWRGHRVDLHGHSSSRRRCRGPANGSNKTHWRRPQQNTTW